ncbi:DUF1573 domain-containing protein [Aporhodopirellula aestuarii]|uniref:DUF1573 domain-containing protein n=1 Tax=Aporhodopirellula aestuarii TaxID=2950107 RepID=A0ABT0U9B6_9BACT|nr:DUF1573 domain-containing protein [Aporhodopirellula aestuarii]MCM2372998.1 DUF1573 domain-containing protein [Aporhodopirellula aestuarii]
MKSHFIKFITLPIAAILMISIAGAFSLAVEYKPYGVPDQRREEYDEKLSLIAQQQRVLQGEIPAEELPLAVVDQTTYDFGMIDPHITASHSFTIRNEGQGPLSLKVAGTSCKCTVGKLEHQLLQPGASTNVTLEWNTGYQAEKYEQTATIVTSDPMHKEIELTVEGEVRAQLIAPESVALVAQQVGEMATGDFVLFSQLWSEFTVMSITSNENDATLNWEVTPIENDDIALADKHPQSAVRVALATPRHRPGQFQGDLTVTIRPGDGSPDITRTITYAGKVRPPISFISPLLHMHEGLHVGTLTAGEESTWHLFVRVRGGEGRKIEVLDVEPKVLQAEIQPTSRDGDYRLTLRVEEDCPMTIFNLDHQRGYVQVGDPADKQFSNWFPVVGAVVELDD